MEISNKDLFLKRISKALGHSGSERSVSCDCLDTRPLQRYTMRLRQGDILDQFKESCLERGTRLEVCALSEIDTTLRKIIAEWGGGKIGVPKSPHWAHYGLAPFIQDPTLHMISWDPEGARHDNIQAFEDVRIGITFPLGAIADTGMVIQQADRLQARSISLLPQAHIAILPLQCLYQTLSDAFAEHMQADAHRYSQVVCIAGPSSTGDIENNIVLGVHGPMYEGILLVEDAQPPALF